MRGLTLAVIMGSFLMVRSCNAKPVVSQPKLIPVTYEFTKGPGSEWKITDPRFALWISKHCYVVEKGKMPTYPSAVYRIECQPSSENEVGE